MCLGTDPCCLPFALYTGNINICLTFLLANSQYMKMCYIVYLGNVVRCVFSVYPFLLKCDTGKKELYTFIFSSGELSENDIHIFIACYVIRTLQLLDMSTPI
jgi:hypothetical protein